MTPTTKGPTRIARGLTRRDSLNCRMALRPRTARVRALLLAMGLLAGPALAADPEPAPDWTYQLVVMVQTEALGKHTGTIAGPGTTGPLVLSGEDCAKAMAALEKIGTSAACMPLGMAEDIHQNN